MRDPKRIKKILKGIEKVWSKYPDLRIGQLIGNVFRNDISLYYVEDEDFLESINSFYIGEKNK